MNSVGGMNDLRGDFVWLHGSRRVAESAEEKKPNGGRHSTENSEEPAVISQVIENQSLMHSLRPILVCARQNSSFVLGDGALRRPGVAARRPYL